MILIESDADALDFDLGCAQILEEADNKRDYARFKMLMLGLQSIAAGIIGGEEAVKKLMDSQAENDDDENDIV